MQQTELYLLQEEDDPHEHLGVQFLQGEESSRRADEDLGLAVSDVVLKAVTLDELLHSIFVRREVVVRPSEFRDHLVPGIPRYKLQMSTCHLGQEGQSSTCYRNNCDLNSNRTDYR